MNIESIINNIKQRVYIETGTYLADKEIASLLKINPTYLCLCKSKITIPYQKIFKLCLDKNWDLNEIFLGKAQNEIGTKSNQTSTLSSDREIVFSGEDIRNIKIIFS
ncbi:MAG: hypothetical protein ACK5LP_02490 [Campylobacteraceae bacterium]